MCSFQIAFDDTKTIQCASSTIDKVFQSVAHGLLCINIPWAFVKNHSIFASLSGPTESEFLLLSEVCIFSQFFWVSQIYNNVLELGL